MDQRANPRVVIVGGGFGGLSAAKALAGAPFEVTLIDRNLITGLYARVDGIRQSPRTELRSQAG